MQKKRIDWIDGVRCLAMFWILFVHFIAVFTPNTNVRFPGFWGLLLFGISGKLAVACFCVLAGYFAVRPAQTSVWRYALRRYLFFALQILVIELLYYAAALLLPRGLYLHRYAPLLYHQPPEVLRDILLDAFALRAQVLPTYWCVDDFIWGSICVMLCQTLVCRQPLWIRALSCAALFGVLLWLDQLWLAICVLGWALKLTEEVRIPCKPLVIAGLICLLPWLIRRGECSLTYLLDGVACLILLWIIGQIPPFQRLIGLKPLAKFGSHTFELFLLHIPIYYVCESLLQLAGWDRPGIAGYTVQFVLSFSLVTLCAFGWRKLADRFLHPLLNRI